MCMRSGSASPTSGGSPGNGVRICGGICGGRQDPLEEMSRRGVFLDLNGTLVEPLKQERLDELTLLPGVAEALARLTAAGFVCRWSRCRAALRKACFPWRTSRPGLRPSRQALEARGALVVGPYVCPLATASCARARKPNVLLYERAVSEHRLTAADYFVIGDSPDDVRATRRLGARGCLVRTGWASNPRVVETALPDASIVADSFAGRWIGYWVWMRVPRFEKTRGQVACLPTLWGRVLLLGAVVSVLLFFLVVLFFTCFLVVFLAVLAGGGWAARSA